MTTSSTSERAGSAPAATDAPRATFGQAARSEWTKLSSLRSTYWALIITVLVASGLAVLSSGGTAEGYLESSPEDRADFYPMADSFLLPIMLSLFGLVALGVLVITSEHATGMIRTSLTAVPRRGRLLAAKFTVFAATALVVGSVCGFAVYGIGQGIFAVQGVPYLTLGDPHVLRSVLGAGLYVMAVGLLAVAVGVLIRATAGAVAVMFAILPFVVPNLLADALGSVSAPLGEFVEIYWPTAAGLSIMFPPDPDRLAPWTGYAVLCGFVAVVIAAAFAVFRKRDV